MTRLLQTVRRAPLQNLRVRLYIWSSRVEFYSIPGARIDSHVMQTVTAILDELLVWLPSLWKRQRHAEARIRHLKYWRLNSRASSMALAVRGSC